MKKIFTIALFYFSYSVLSAQVQFGEKAGYNLSHVLAALQENVTQRSLPAFNAGLVASVPLSTHWYVHPELVYSVQGNYVNFHSTQDDEAYKNTYYYLNIPVMIIYQHASGLFAETGPQLGILLSAYFSDEQGQYFSEKGYMQPLDFSWAFGLGYKLSKINLGIDARYNLKSRSMQLYNQEFHLR